MIAVACILIVGAFVVLGGSLMTSPSPDEAGTDSENHGDQEGRSASSSQDAATTDQVLPPGKEPPEAGRTLELVPGQVDGNGVRQPVLLDEDLLAVSAVDSDEASAQQQDFSDELEATIGDMIADFEASRPLTQEDYQAIVSQHRKDVFGAVLKQAAAIGEEQGPEAGQAFLAAYNARMAAYRAEAKANSAQ